MAGKVTIMVLQVVRVAGQAFIQPTELVGLGQQVRGATVVTLQQTVPLVAVGDIPLSG